jgi:hypothetical protein
MRIIARGGPGADEGAAAAAVPPAPLGRKKTAVVVGGVRPWQLATGTDMLAHVRWICLPRHK